MLSTNNNISNTNSYTIENEKNKNKNLEDKVNTLSSQVSMLVKK